MSTATLNSVKYAYVAKNLSGNMSSQTTQRISNRPSTYDPRMLLSFEELPASLKYKQIVRTKLFAYVTVTGRVSCASIAWSSEDFDTGTVMYSTAPQKAGVPDRPWAWEIGENAHSGQQSAWVSGNGYYDARISLELLKAKTIWPSDLFFYSETEFVQGSGYVTTESDLIVYTPLSTSKPYLLVEYDDDDIGLTVVPTSQTGGYVNPHARQTFSWRTLPQSLYTFETPTQANAVFAWREVGSSSEHTVAISGDASSVEIAAETFPGASAIEWQVRVHSTSDVWTSSDWIELSTADTLASATLVSPVTTIEDANAPIVFKWTAANDSGSAPSGADLQYSLNAGSSWTQLAHLSGATSSYTAAAETFPVGDVYWRVRVYNIDGVAGAWSQSFFTAFAAPNAPALSVNNVPFVVLTWQSEGQQAYQLEIDGEDLGPTFGTGKSYTSPVPLADGSHVARARIQNLYGLWSEWSEVPFLVENVPGDDIELFVDFGIDASLRWSAVTAPDILVFRDGALIGHTSDVAFIDRFVLGTHEYYVVNRLASGNYSKSNSVAGTLRVRGVAIAEFPGGQWMDLRRSDRSLAEQSFSWNRTHSLRHIAGAKYPVLEISPYEDESGTYDVAFSKQCEADAFRTLYGKVVILKSHDDKTVIGALVEMREIINTFYLAYRFTVQQIQWEDYIDADKDG